MKRTKKKFQREREKIMNKPKKDNSIDGLLEALSFDIEGAPQRFSDEELREMGDTALKKFLDITYLPNDELIEDEPEE